MLSITDCFHAVQIGVFAAVFCGILTRPGMIFAKYWLFLDGLNEKYPYIAKPLGYCAVCFAGQIALWHCVLGHDYFRIPIYIGVSIFAAHVAGRWADDDL